MKELAGLNNTKDYIDLERIRENGPALLEALEEIYEMVQQNYHVDENNMATIDKAYAAIKAARGEV